MKQIVCEMCGGKDLVKQNSVFVCQNCQAKYSVEEAKKMLIETDAPANLKSFSQTEYSKSYQPKSKLIALLLCLFAGGLGAHRFYVGKIGTGILMLLFTVPSVITYYNIAIPISTMINLYKMGLLEYKSTIITVNIIFFMVVFGIWPIIDLIRIATDNFTDSNGYILSENTGI